MTNWYKNFIKKYQGQKITSSDLKKLFFIIPIAIVVTASFYFIAQFYLKTKKNQINKNKCSTTCQITDVRENRGTYVLFDYQINGITYSDRKPSPYGAFKGANYVLLYQCNDPRNIEINVNSVFFNENDLKDTLVTTLNKINVLENFYSFSFIDNDGVEINGTQEINNSLNNKIKDNSIKVAYLKSDHNKAILH
jgi:hypothetical protein